ncbi:hypothetical protein [Portibacter lacus]|uniref:Lipoprotein n=1 Tax=Portibacter lacus TaxID=1099794 RepID=A0AA37SJD9_9BACT|nr:hypothetical protein [Portibacter lacus]GLR15878.1 hypothetical protein GCM10007940_04930 [Portibacter lacus]
MKYKFPWLNIICALGLILMISSCETDEQRYVRIKLEIEIKKSEAKLIAETEAHELIEKERNERIEQEERIKREKQKIEEAERRKALEKKRNKELAEIEKWKSNSLLTGATPWSNCYGKTNYCNSNSCSQISVKTPYSSDVIVTLKQNGSVVRHAYIHKRSSFTFEIPDGSYQPFFYYGNGWNPNKSKNSSVCGTLKGAFVSGESISKDKIQILSNNILSYELILQENGNLQTKPSNEEEAF